MPMQILTHPNEIFVCIACRVVGLTRGEVIEIEGRVVAPSEVTFYVDVVESYVPRQQLVV